MRTSSFVRVLLLSQSLFQVPATTAPQDDAMEQDHFSEPEELDVTGKRLLVFSKCAM